MQIIEETMTSLTQLLLPQDKIKNSVTGTQLMVMMRINKNKKENFQEEKMKEINGGIMKGYQ